MNKLLVLFILSFVLADSTHFDSLECAMARRNQPYPLTFNEEVKVSVKPKYGIISANINISCK